MNRALCLLFLGVLMSMPALAEKKPHKSKPLPEAPKEPVKPAEDPQLVRTFPPGTPEATLREMLRCGAEMRDESAAFDCYLKLQVEGNRDTEVAVAQVKHYSWKVFRSRAQSYLVPPKDPAKPEVVVKITRREPEKCQTAPVDGKLAQCKFYLESAVRDMPAPVTFQWEDGQWRIFSSSL